MSTNLWIFILLLPVTCAGSAQSINISGEVGSMAVLPCKIPSTQLTSSSPHVEWCTVDETVFERAGAEMFQGEGYKDRADVPEDKLQEGNCSLVLKNITHGDAGDYESYLIVNRKKRSLRSKRVLLQRVELSVQDAPQGGENKAPERNEAMLHTSSWVIYIILLLLHILFYIL